MAGRAVDRPGGIGEVGSRPSRDAGAIIFLFVDPLPVPVGQSHSATRPPITSTRPRLASLPILVPAAIVVSPTGE